ncbi:hypothetical protein Tco_0952294 [Tanacetum coccineum]|uniref:Uncharacterized protein n=1 Tax=Tanacetum coccineum TaxID=301880 RepID=A0ABQ5DXH9_9ASTR
MQLPAQGRWKPLRNRRPDLEYCAIFRYGSSTNRLHTVKETIGNRPRIRKAESLDEGNLRHRVGRVRQKSSPHQEAKWKVIGKGCVVDEGSCGGHVRNCFGKHTNEGIRANPKKTKAISDLTSPKTLKEMQSLVSRDPQEISQIFLSDAGWSDRRGVLSIARCTNWVDVSVIWTLFSDGCSQSESKEFIQIQDVLIENHNTREVKQKADILSKLATVLFQQTSPRDSSGRCVGPLHAKYDVFGEIHMDLWNGNRPKSGSPEGLRQGYYWPQCIADV